MVKIGLVAPFEGANRALGYEALLGAKLALAEVNADGGVSGYKVELVALDHSSQLEQARLQALEMVEDPAVLGVIAGWTDELAQVSLPEYQDLGMPVVVPWTVSPELANIESGTVLLAADSERVSGTLARSLPSAKSQRVVVAGDGQLGETYVNSIHDRGIVVESIPLPGIPNREAYDDWAAILILGRARPPDAIVSVADGYAAAETLRSLRQLGWQGDAWGSPDVGCAQAVDVAAAAADGLVFASPTPAGRDLAFAASRKISAGVYDLSPRGVAAYDAVLVLLKALEIDVEQGGHPSRQGVSESFAGLQMEGLTGTVAFDRDGRRLDAPTWMYRIKDSSYPGELVPIRD